MARFDINTYIIPANNELSIGLSGNYVACLDATAEFQIALGDQSPTKFREGLKFGGVEFQHVRLVNNTGSDITAELAIGEGDIEDFSSVINGAVATRSGDTIDNGNVSVGTSAVQIVAASLNTGRVFVQNLSANNLYVGKTGVTTANGLLLAPNETLNVETGAAIYGIASGAASDIRWFKEAL